MISARNGIEQMRLPWCQFITHKKRNVCPVFQDLTIASQCCTLFRRAQCQPHQYKQTVDVLAVLNEWNWLRHTRSMTPLICSDMLCSISLCRHQWTTASFLVTQSIRKFAHNRMSSPLLLKIIDSELLVARKSIPPAATQRSISSFRDEAVWALVVL